MADGLSSNVSAELRTQTDTGVRSTQVRSVVMVWRYRWAYERVHARRRRDRTKECRAVANVLGRQLTLTLTLTLANPNPCHGAPCKNRASLTAAKQRCALQWHDMCAFIQFCFGHDEAVVDK